MTIRGSCYRNRGTVSPIQSIVLVQVERAIPLISPAYDSGASEDEIRARWEQHQESLKQERDAKKSET